MFFCLINKTPGGASVTYVLMSIKYLRPRGGCVFLLIIYLSLKSRTCCCTDSS